MSYRIVRRMGMYHVECFRRFWFRMRWRPVYEICYAGGDSFPYAVTFSTLKEAKEFLDKRISDRREYERMKREGDTVVWWQEG